MYYYLIYFVEIEHYSNLDLSSIVTPLDVKRFEELLKESEYPKEEMEFLLEGFTNGFDIGYKGPEVRQSTSTNIPFSVGDNYDLWAKIMKEVKAKRFAGPFKEIPFKNYIQSPIGLVPKAGGKTRLIFHLSFKFGDSEEEQSLNGATPREDCTVRYNDIDTAVENCLYLSKELKHNTAPPKDGAAEEETVQPLVFLGKTNLSSAFRMLPLQISCICWLVMVAEDPSSGEWVYFVDKCLPFGASISCLHYQRFSNALKHIMQYRTGCKKALTNYLDDFLFAAIAKWLCNKLIQQFLDLCNELNIPVTAEKMVWSSTQVVFLDILLDGRHLVLCIPLEKREKAMKLLHDLEGKKKVTVKQLQILTGYLNFLTKAIQPGRTFTRRIYAKYAKLKQGPMGKPLKPYHHVRIDNELRFDCEIWKFFLQNYRNKAVCSPMVDFQDSSVTSKELMFYSDASGKIGFELYLTTSIGYSPSGNRTTLKIWNQA